MKRIIGKNINLSIKVHKKVHFLNFSQKVVEQVKSQAVPAIAFEEISEIIWVVKILILLSQNK